MNCQTPKCGQHQLGAGRPKVGWYNVRTAGDPKGVWFCSYECVARAFGADQDVDPEIPENLKPHEALKHLNRLARRCVTPYDVTPDKVRRMLDLAFKRLVDQTEADVACLEERSA